MRQIALKFKRLDTSKFMRNTFDGDVNILKMHIMHTEMWKINLKISVVCGVNVQHV